MSMRVDASKESVLFLRQEGQEGQEEQRGFYVLLAFLCENMHTNPAFCMEKVE